ncbi:MAG: hypothetical protein IPL36_03800 [Nigerium sp.]|nr:hypothetical protein [Nigerium sp.]
MTAIAAHGAVRIETIDPGGSPDPGRLRAGALLTRGGVRCAGGGTRLPTGLSTALVVCAILAAGAAVVATQPDRRAVW